MRTVFTNFLVDELLPTKLSQAGFQLDYQINKLKVCWFFLTIFREEWDMFLGNFYFVLVVMKLQSNRPFYKIFTKIFFKL